jgi:cobalt/nickel transport system ATP-binding protein
MVQELFPRMIVLDGGTVVADGETKEVLKNEELLETHGLEMP